MGWTEGFLNVADHFLRSCRSVVFSIIGRQNHHIIHKGSCLIYIYITILVTSFKFLNSNPVKDGPRPGLASSSAF